MNDCEPTSSRNTSATAAPSVTPKSGDVGAAPPPPLRRTRLPQSAWPCSHAGQGFALRRRKRGVDESWLLMCAVTGPSLGLAASSALAAPASTRVSTPSSISSVRSTCSSRSISGWRAIASKRSSRCAKAHELERSRIGVRTLHDRCLVADGRSCRVRTDRDSDLPRPTHSKESATLSPSWSSATRR